MDNAMRILVAEDNELDVELMLHALRAGGIAASVDRVDAPSDFAAAERGERWDAVLSDCAMPGFDGLEALRLHRELRPDVPFIIVTGSLDEETAAECIKRGADDYVTKENLVRLPSAVRNATAKYAEQRERRRLERQVQHMQRMQALGQLAAGVAHDVNNLLAVVAAHAEILEGHPALDRDLRRSLDAMEQAVRHACTVTRSLLLFARGGGACAETVDLATVARGVVRLLRSALPSRIRLELDAAPGCLVEADPTLLQQALVNLVLNARDALPGEGTIAIAVRPAGADRVEVEVRDDGEGMTPEVLERALEPFFTTKPPGLGTGLGLSMVHGIVADLGGTLAIESEPGRGTTCRIVLPTATAGGSTVAAETDGPLVLLVSADLDTRAVLASALLAAGFRVVSARGHEDAAPIVSQRSGLGLVIADEDACGADLPHCLAGFNAAHPSVPVVVASTHPDAAEERLADLAVVVPKPFRVHELVRLALRLLPSARAAE